MNTFLSKEHGGDIVTEIELTRRYFAIPDWESLLDDLLTARR